MILPQVAIGGVLTAVMLTALPAHAEAAAITLDLRVVRKPSTYFRGEPRPAHELVNAIVRRAPGRTDFSLAVSPRPFYAIQAIPESDTTYRIDPASLRVASAGAVKAEVAIRYPKLSNKQYAALRSSRDYRVVYGLMRAIVEHEELHARVFARYVREIQKIYTSPPLGKSPAIVVDAAGVSHAFATYVDNRLRHALDTARKRSDTQQHAIDHTGKTTEVLMDFSDVIDGEVPSSILYSTEGKFRAVFDVPEGRPRPPEPRKQY